MARRSSRGRSGSGSASDKAPVGKPLQPARRAPPPAPVQSGAPSVLGGLGSAVVDGMALGTGSAIAHRAVDAVMGPRTIRHETVASAAASSPTVTTTSSDVCTGPSKAFQDCISSSGSDTSKCQFYLDMLNECRRGSTTVL